MAMCGSSARRLTGSGVTRPGLASSTSIADDDPSRCGKTLPCHALNGERDSAAMQLHVPSRTLPQETFWVTETQRSIAIGPSR